MKKHLLLVLIAIMAMGQSAFAQGYDFSVVVSSGQRLYFNITGENTVKVINPDYPTLPSGDLVIPSSVTNDGITYSVTRISGDAFNGCSGLTSVTIPNSVTSIEDGGFIWGTFCNCYNLASVSIPNSVDYIGKYAFGGCISLTSLTISVTTIGPNAFDGCTGLTSVTIGNSVTSIGVEAFRRCSPTSVYYTGTIAQWCGINFAGYESNPLKTSHCLNYNGGTVLTDLVIPEGVTEIKPYVFISCTSLTSVVLPSTLTSIGVDAFRDCTALTSIECQSTTPPSLSNNPFPNYNIPVSVLCGSVSDYQSAPYWENFTSIQDNCGTPQTTYYTVSITSNNNIWGVAYGGGSIAEGQTTTLTATANSGFRFLRWDDGNTDNPRTLTVTSDTSIVAQFEADGIVHDTIYINGNSNFSIHPDGSAIVVEGAMGYVVTLFDASRNVLNTQCAIDDTPIRFEPLTSGTYFVKVGNIPIRMRLDLD